MPVFLRHHTFVQFEGEANLWPKVLHASVLECDGRRRDFLKLFVEYLTIKDPEAHCVFDF